MIRTRPFYPSIGGLEAVMQMLAEEFARAGHAVTVVTASRNDKPDAFPFQVLRQPSLGRLLEAHREADVVIFGNISLWWFLTLCLCPRPWVATHHGWYFDTGKPVKWMDRLKVALTGLANANVSVSAAVNRFLGHPGIVIPNPFDHETFRLMPDVSRDRDLFLGRLVSDKGADVLVEALALLKHKGLRPSLTMIGSGPELEHLQKQAASLGVEDQIDFTGPLRGEELARSLNAHRIMVIPSRCSEGFGLVVIEESRVVVSQLLFLEVDYPRPLASADWSAIQ
ncbi:MAG: glycosyltransferase family 4 protein [Verrucomicrobiaceae bacterium]|nr:glycosyltransferase family 4 protein [Verrucomicrobiaceae bacterium]